MSPDLRGDVDFKCDLRGGLKLLRLLAFGIFYDRVVIQYQENFFFRGWDEDGSKSANVVTALSFALLFLLHRRKIELVCHEIHMHPVESIGLPNLIAQYVMWRVAPRLVFHTQRELDAFVRKYGGHKRRGLELRSHDRDFRKFADLSQADARALLEIPPGVLVFLCIGFIQPHKGFDRAIAAFNARNPSNAKLYVVGSLRLRYDATIKYLDTLRSMASKNPSVAILDRYVSDAEFDTWLAACDYVVVPYREIWSSSVVARAKLFNRGVVAADVGGLAEQLGAADRLFTTDAELEELIAELTARAVADPPAGVMADRMPGGQALTP
jgi:glycosyltransferase involved in cell wall biosynthesis